MASNSEAEFKRHYTQVCHCEWSEDEFTRQTTSENCVMHGNVPDPLAALLAERQQDKQRIEQLEAALTEARPYVEWMAAGPRDAADDASTAKAILAQVDAALAVEEDATP